MRRWLCLLMVLTALAGCDGFADDRVNAKVSDVLGTWHEPDSDTTLVLTESMSFETDDAVPFFKGCTTCVPPTPVEEGIKGSGTWELGPPIGQDAGNPNNYVHLRFTTVDHEHLSKSVPSTHSVRVERTPDGLLVLSAYDGNAQTGYGHIFYKQ